MTSSRSQRLWRNVFSGGALFAATLCGQSAEPRISSIHPLTGQAGQTWVAAVRGTSLKDTKAALTHDAGIKVRVIRVEDLPPAAPAEKTPPQLAHIEITAPAGTKPGVQRLRLLTAAGLSNEIPFRVADQPVTVEPASEERGVAALPAVVAGTLSSSGEYDDYWFEAKAGQTVTLEAYSGSDTLDPSVALYERSGSWFDASRLNRLVSNDESLPFPAIPKDARVSWKIERTGKYCVRVQGFPGQGSPDGVYELRITPAPSAEPDYRPVLKAGWEERELTRSLSEDWMKQVASRGAARDTAYKAPERYRGVPVGSAEIPVLKLPGFMEGVIAKPGEIHTIRIEVEKAQDVVIEVETPEATTPRFTPVVRLMEPGGTEIVGNVYTRLNNNNLKMMKSIKAKTAFSLAAPGTYTLEVHELTTDCAGPDYRYRILVRPQIPHVGRFIVAQDRVNLERGSTKPVSVRIEREEGYAGIVAVQVENLPSGITALTAVENPPERPTMPNAGKPERYEPRIQTTSVVLAAAADAPVSETAANIRVVARPVVDGRLGEPVSSIEVPLAVLGKRE